MNQQPTMRALLQREITEQECYIKKTLTELGIPFKKSLHFRVSKAYTSFSVELKKKLPPKELLKIQQAFPEGFVTISDSFIGQITKGKFVEIRIPNQTSLFFHLRELLSSRQFALYKGILPITLGLDDKDLYIIDLATTKHIAIESDEPSYLYKIQQLFLHSLLTLRPFQKRAKIVWIDERKQHPELLSRIEPFMLTEATQVEEILTLVMEEYEKRKAENSFENHWAVFVNDAYATYHKYKEMFNSLEGCEAQGIHLIGTSECLDKDTMTVMEVMEYNSLFNSSLWFDTKHCMHHERTIIQLPFFTEEMKFSHETILSIEERIVELLKNREKKALEPMDFPQVQRILSSSMYAYSLHSSDERIKFPLKDIHAILPLRMRKFFDEIFVRLSRNIIYFVEYSSKKLTELKELHFDSKSGQVLINGETVYTPTQDGDLIPFVAKSQFDFGLHTLPQSAIFLDQLDMATYPQLWLVSEGLQRWETCKEIAPQLNPIALLSEIEDILSKVEFQLVSKNEFKD